MMVVNGEILMATATCPPATVIADLFKTLLRVRQAEFEAQAGVNNPDAWNTGAAEPGVPIDLERELGGEEFGSAYARWRRQWFNRITLHPWQEKLRDNLPHGEFAKRHGPGSRPGLTSTSATAMSPEPSSDTVPRQPQP